MYKVYVNDIPLFLGTPDSIGELGLLPAKDVVTAPYIGKRKELKWYVDFLEKNSGNIRVCALYAEDADKLWADFRSCFTELPAAGGCVFNEQQELLVFFRRGSWDLPKGKIDPGETPEQASVREVQEETGLVNLDRGPLLHETATATATAS
jgi:NUDIX domain